MFKRFEKILLWMAPFLLFSIAAMSQDTKHPFYKFSHLSSLYGLPQNSVLSVLQDTAGFCGSALTTGLPDMTATLLLSISMIRPTLLVLVIM
jgi:hypothetical protein